MNTEKLLRLAEKMADRGHDDLATIVRDVVAEEELEADLDDFDLEADFDLDDFDLEADFDLEDLEADLDDDFDFDLEADLDDDFDLDSLEADLDDDFDLDSLEADLDDLEFEADLDSFLDDDETNADEDLEADFDIDALEAELQAELDAMDLEADEDLDLESALDDLDLEADEDFEADFEDLDLVADYDIEYEDDAPVTAETLFEDEHFWWETRRAAYSSEDNLHFVTRVAHDPENAIKIGEAEAEKGMLSLLTGGTADAWGQLTKWAAFTYKNNNEKISAQRLATWAEKNSNTKRDLGVGAIAVAITAELYKENVDAARAYRSLSAELRTARSTEEISGAYSNFGKAVAGNRETLKALAKARSFVAAQAKTVAARAARTAAAL